MNTPNLCAKIKRLLVTFSLIGLIFCTAHASSDPQKQAEETLSALYHSINNMPNMDMAERLDIISTKFLGKPYVLGALGEGKGGKFDQSPLFRTDGFDCETYVTTILAITLADSTQTFKQCLRKLRYSQGKLGFIHRNHFTGLDWNQNNQQQGYVKDITTTITDKNHKPVAKIASALIDKPSWYQHFTLKNIKLLENNPKEQSTLLAELKSRGNKLPRTISNLAYLPLTALFDKQGNPNKYLFEQIPDGSIIEIVRPNWDLKKEIGTCLNVSHLGFAFWKKGQLIFREASSQYNKVVDVSLEEYLKQALDSPTIKGINVQIIVPRKPLTNDCLASN